MKNIFSPADLKVKLKEEAENLGFDGFGVCASDDFSESDAARLRRWLEAGMNDKMSYLSRAYSKKISPRAWFPAARSAVCVTANFYRESSERRIALYAQSADYHDVLRPKLETLASILAVCGGEQKISVDSSPLWEKLLARRAGIGWTGKSTLTIRPQNGPWSFFGIILTSLELPPDSELENRCGDCRKCVEACPNGAITPFGVDARKCISNLTIERKDELSAEEKNMTRGKIFGCDLCLRACPFTPRATMPIMPEFNTVKKLGCNPSAGEIASAAEGTPMQRRFRPLRKGL